MAAPSAAIAFAAPETAGLSRTSFMAEALRTPSEPPIRFIDNFSQTASRIFGVTVTSRPPGVSSDAKVSSLPSGLPSGRPMIRRLRAFSARITPGAITLLAV